jgi:hypothetical protein
MSGKKKFAANRPPFLEVMPHARERVQLVLDRDAVQERSPRADHEREGAVGVEVERAHVALVPGDVQARLRRDLLRQHGEHLRAGVDPHHGHPRARDRHRDATRSDRQLEDGAAEALGEVAVEGEVVPKRAVLEVVRAGEGGVARHLHACSRCEA